MKKFGTDFDLRMGCFNLALNICTSLDVSYAYGSKKPGLCIGGLSEVLFEIKKNLSNVLML